MSIKISESPKKMTKKNSQAKSISSRLFQPTYSSRSKSIKDSPEAENSQSIKLSSEKTPRKKIKSPKTKYKKEPIVNFEKVRFTSRLIDLGAKRN
jgi:hypothetical protein